MAVIPPVARVALTLTLALAGLLAGAAAAQTPDPGSTAPRPTTLATPPVPSTLPVPADHWVYDLLDGLDASGQLEVDGTAWIPGRRPATLAAILDALAAVNDDGPWGGTARGAREWLLREHGLAPGRSVRLVPVVAAGLHDGAGGEPDALRAGLEVAWAPAPSVALFAGPAAELPSDDGPAVVLPRAGAAWRTGPVVLSARRVGIGWGRGLRGGTVVANGATVTGVSVALSRPVTPTGVLGWLGAVDGSFSVNRIADDQWGPTAILLLGEARLRPHPRVEVYLHRSALVAAEASRQTIDARDIAFIIVGKHTSYDDQRAAVGVSVRLTVGGVDLLPYLEWGIEDTAGLDEDPGVIAGVRVPGLLLGTTPVGLAYEYVGFGRDARALWGAGCCFERRNWYRHGAQPRLEYRDAEGAILGHPLGGYGHEHRIEAFAPVTGVGVVGRLGLLFREREPGNLEYTALPGHSRGVYLDLSVLRGPVALALGGRVEVGSEGWRRADASVGLRWMGPDRR